MDPPRKHSPNIERSPMISYQDPDQTTRRTSFFDLPFDIRDQVYSELIPQRLEIVAYDLYLSGECFDRINAFALVSRQFRAEVLHKLYAQSTIQVRFGHYVPKLCTGLLVQRVIIYDLLEIRKVAETKVSTVEQEGSPSVPTSGGQQASEHCHMGFDCGPGCKQCKRFPGAGKITIIREVYAGWEIRMISAEKTMKTAPLKNVLKTITHNRDGLIGLDTDTIWCLVYASYEATSRGEMP
ncbi:MAG: hypothetical protein Q9171_005297 [Xanthocarpia ochracea]